MLLPRWRVAAEVFIRFYATLAAVTPHAAAADAAILMPYAATCLYASCVR